jgi:hypothetical protein
MTEREQRVADVTWALMDDAEKFYALKDYYRRHYPPDRNGNVSLAVVLESYKHLHNGWPRPPE